MLSTTAHQQLLRVEHSNGRIELSVNLRRDRDDLVLLLHGLGCAKESFDAAFTAEQLYGLSVCAFDFPGHGRSSRLPGDMYSLPTYAEIAAAVVRQLDPRRVFLVGHSMGGAVGLLALRDIGSCASFISVEGNLVAEDCGLISRQAADQDLGEFVDNDFQLLLAGLRRSPRADLRAWGAWYAESDPVAVHAISRSLVEWSDCGALVDLFRSSPRPAYLYGTESAGIRHLAAALDGITAHPIPASGHFPMIDQPDRFWRLIAAHLIGPPSNDLRRQLTDRS